MELNKTCAGGDEKDGTKRFQEMSFIMPAESEQYSGIRNDLKNSTLMATCNYPRTKTAAYDAVIINQQYNNKYMEHHQRSRSSNLKIQKTKR